MDIQQILRPLQQFEEKLGELYAWIGEALADDREVAADFHFRKAIAQLNPDVARLMESLGRADREHVERLLELAQRRGLLGPDTPMPAPPK